MFLCLDPPILFQFQLLAAFQLHVCSPEQILVSRYFLLRNMQVVWFV